jgi:hypothetical protein
MRGYMVTRAFVRTAVRSLLGSLALAAAVLGAGGCGDIFGSSDLDLSVSVSDTLVGPDRPITVTLLARSTGDPVAWGRGSSSCQLTAVVQAGGEDHSIDLRVCTEDLVVQGVAGGDTLTERWTWNAEYVVNGVLDTLPAGRYRLFALAGDSERSGGTTVRVEGE